MKNLVVYFSAGGATEKAAQVIAQEAGADLLKLEPAEPYPTFLPLLFAAGGLGALSGKPRALKPHGLDWSAYRNIYLGTPTWMSHPAPPVRQFILDHEWKGKQVALFATCSHMAGNNLVHLQVMIQGATVFGKKVFNAHELKDKKGVLKSEVADWIARLRFFPPQ